MAAGKVDVATAGDSVTAVAVVETVVVDSVVEAAGADAVATEAEARADVRDAPSCGSSNRPGNSNPLSSEQV